MSASVAMSARPTVALVAHDVHDCGGMERVCAELIRRSHRDFDFIVVAARLAPALRPCVREWIRVHAPQHPFPLKYLAFWLGAARRVRSLDVDLTHTVGAVVPQGADVVAVHFCHAGFVAAERCLMPRSAPLPRRMNTALSRLLALAAERWCYRPGRVRAFAAVSVGVGEEVSRHFPGIPVHVTPNGVDHARFRPDTAVREQVRADQGVGDAPVAVFVGGDWDHKGLPLVIEALARVRRNDGDLQLWVVGAGDRDRLAALAARLGVEGAVSFLGPRDDVERFLAAADMFVLPSMYETFSLVAFEAAACGLPIIATNVHGVCDLIGGGEAGIVVERDAESVADAMSRLARDAGLRMRLGRTALERSRRYTWKASADAVTDIYRSLLSERLGVSA